MVNPCAPLLRVSPDLDSTPVAQLSSLSGTIYTADPLKAFGRSPTTTAAAAATPALTTNGTNKDISGETGAGDSTSPVASPGLTADVRLVAGTVEAHASAEETGLIDDGSSDRALSGKAGVTAKNSSSDAVRVRTVESEGAGQTARGQNPSQHPSQHPLVLSGRRVWVISPVVGWASVWAETGQNILTPAGIEDSDDGKGSIEKGVVPPKQGSALKMSIFAKGGHGGAAAKNGGLLLIGVGGPKASKAEGAAGSKEGEGGEKQATAVYPKGKANPKAEELGPSMSAVADSGKTAAMDAKAIPAASAAAGTDMGSTNETKMPAPLSSSSPPPPPLPALLSLSLDESITALSPSAVADPPHVPGPADYPSQLSKDDALKFLASMSPDMIPLVPPPSSVPGAAWATTKTPPSFSSSSSVPPAVVLLSPPSTYTINLSPNGAPIAGFVGVEPALPAPGGGGGGVALGGGGAGAVIASPSTGSSSSLGSPLPPLGFSSDSCASSPLPPPSGVSGGAINNSVGLLSSGGGDGGGEGEGEGGGQLGVPLTFGVDTGAIDFDEEAKKTE